MLIRRNRAGILRRHCIICCSWKLVIAPSRTQSDQKKTDRVAINGFGGVIVLCHGTECGLSLFSGQVSTRHLALSAAASRSHKAGRENKVQPPLSANPSHGKRQVQVQKQTGYIVQPLSARQESRFSLKLASELPVDRLMGGGGAALSSYSGPRLSEFRSHLVVCCLLKISSFLGHLPTTAVVSLLVGRDARNN